MSRLIEIINGIKHACEQTGLVAVHPNNILDNSIKIMISENIDKSKKEMVSNYSNQQKTSQKPNESENKPSDKQIALLNKLKIKIPNTKKEATVLIRENINKYQEY